MSIIEKSTKDGEVDLFVYSLYQNAEKWGMEIPDSKHLPVSWCARYLIFNFIDDVVEDSVKKYIGCVVIPECESIVSDAILKHGFLNITKDPTKYEDVCNAVGMVLVATMKFKEDIES